MSVDRGHVVFVIKSVPNFVLVAVSKLQYGLFVV